MRLARTNSLLESRCNHLVTGKHTHERGRHLPGALESDHSRGGVWFLRRVSLFGTLSGFAAAPAVSVFERSSRLVFSRPDLYWRDMELPSLQQSCRPRRAILGAAHFGQYTVGI